MFKKILALVMALLLASLALAACKKEESPFIDTPQDPNEGLTETGPVLVDGGAIGTSALRWELYNDGTLYIKGEGEMGELEKGEGDSVIHPWYKYMTGTSGTVITSLVVENGVTSLAASAFAGCTKLEDASVAPSVSVIPEKCFKYCERLGKVTAKGVIRIEDNAFDSCLKLGTVTFSASLELVGDGAFLYAGEEVNYFSVRLAGTAEEWNAAKVKMDANENDEYAIWTGNEKLLTGLEQPAFVDKGATVYADPE